MRRHCIFSIDGVFGVLGVLGGGWKGGMRSRD